MSHSGEARDMTERKRIVVGVAGGIAAYKACTVVRNSPRPVTLSGSSRPSPRCGSSVRPPSKRCPGNPCAPACSRMFAEVPHVRIGQEADLVVVAPATADLMARAVAGRADDLLTATLLTARCPVLFAPAMHTEMWLHPATVANVDDPAATRCHRPRARVRSAHRRRHRPGPAARGGGDHALAQLLLERPDALPYDLVGRQGARHRRWHPRAARSGAVHRQPQLGQAGIRDGAGRRPARRRGHADRGQHRRARSTRRASRSCTSARPASCATRSPSTPPTRTCSSWRPRSPTSGPTHVATTKIKKSARAGARRCARRSS